MATKKKSPKPKTGTPKRSPKRAPQGEPNVAPAQAAGQPQQDDRKTPGTGKIDFPVVAIGASAGGLEAFSTLLEKLPPDTGMAFVFIQHLDPTHESLLVDLLARSTRMSVEQVREGVRVRPNCVHVIPPGTYMAIDGTGTLHLSPRPPGRGQPMPIDRFFRSLAENIDSPVGVVLSGTSSDGALGLRDIKDQGGITFAQDEQSAKYAGMPHAAAATGSADFLLDPAGIAQELVRVSKHIRALPEEEPPAEAQPPRRQYPAGAAMSRILALLRSATSIDFTLYKTSTIRRRIARRMAIHRMETLEDYAKLLEQNPSEVQALYREALIKVTSFFRDADMFQMLKSKVFPQLFGRLQPDSQIRVWVPGCATGEEAYSLAILLLEYLGERSLIVPIQIFGTDVSEEAIEKARAGIYPENIAADVSPERMRRFFVQHEAGFQVSKTVRDLCVFARQNLAKDPPFSRLDIVSCRNVLIYLEPALQKRIIPMFHYALKPNGLLILGNSETVGPFEDLFEPVDKRHRMYTKRQIAVMPRFDFEPGGAFARGEPGARAVHAEENVTPDFQKEADRLVLARYSPPGVIINEEFEVIQFRGRTSKYIEPAPGRASLSLLKMLKEGLLLEVRNAVQRAKRTGAPVTQRNVAAKQNGGFHSVDFDVIPLQPGPKGTHFLILFQDSPEPAPRKGRDKDAESAQTEQLKQELVATRQYLQSIIEEQEATNEELQSANEEILSSNEELQSINEELETAKEELQSTNEELTTVNEELQNGNAELSRTNDDLNNLLSSVNLPIVMLGSDLTIRRFTPIAGRILNLIPSDVGRPITDLRPGIQLPDLSEVVREVVDTVTAKVFEVADGSGQPYSLSVRPYRTSDNRIDGAVLTLIDMDTKRGFEQLERAREFTEAALDAAGVPLIVLDANLRVLRITQPFRELCEAPDGELSGRDLDSVLADAGALKPLLNEAKASGALIRDRRVALRLPSGRTGVNAVARALTTAAGEQVILLTLTRAQS